MEYHSVFAVYRVGCQSQSYSQITDNWYHLHYCILRGKAFLWIFWLAGEFCSFKTGIPGGLARCIARRCVFKSVLVFS